MGPLVLEVPDWPKLPSLSGNALEVREARQGGSVVFLYVTSGSVEIQDGALPQGAQRGVPIPVAGSLAQSWELPLGSNRVLLSYQFQCAEGEDSRNEPKKVFLMVEGQRAQAGELVGLMLATVRCQDRPLPQPRLSLKAEIPETWLKKTVGQINVASLPQDQFFFVVGRPVISTAGFLPEDRILNHWLSLSLQEMLEEDEVPDSAELTVAATEDGARRVYATVPYLGQPSKVLLQVWPCPGYPALASFLAVGKSVEEIETHLGEVGPIACVPVEIPRKEEEEEEGPEAEAQPL